MLQKNGCMAQVSVSRFSSVNFSQVFESDQEHRNEVMRLQDRLSTLEAETAQHESVLNTITSTNKEKISKLQEEKAMLEVSAQNFNLCQC